ncbi:hypothetical protein OO007_00570 [Cocleimonas sp. KMM 6892]|uniref:hypothetical protein n=1 Tax=unclassified Cocleimonas TaxID=2639732 RepID=UPI002DB9AAEA|nr:MULTISPECIES: hypothetical protein [unclassified Cocleimonas]MEB8430704.1 hypothetical protein [Cocleimonas sp. KMM 6892]MEC4714524.1 hypothetical protein [Cocleimonas sp. KMM 6895]MEC4743857.1 hypothetical protein [Cocleimonas sp. KMM 6896]
MKVKAFSAVAAASLLGLSACSQQSAAPQNTANSSKTYYVQTPKHTPKPQQVVFQQQRRAPTYKQSVSQQQVRRPVVQQPRVVARPAQPSPDARQQAELSELYGIGDQIFKNETGGRIDQLVHWNLREDFAAMGIGHFTWYPSGRSQRFGNTFPGLLDYLQKNGVQLPAWVQRARFEGAPWRNREQLMAAKNSPEIKQFSQLLYNTRHLQAKYIMDRAMRAMPKLVKNTPQHLRGQVANNLNAVANSRGGRYVLVDYVNFKGEGLNRSGGYKGQNWGLLQVLEEMRPVNPGQQALNEFADASMRVLERRVRNSNPSRNEKKWLPGWRNRTNTYRNPI